MLRHAASFSGRRPPANANLFFRLQNYIDRHANRRSPECGDRVSTRETYVRYAKVHCVEDFRRFVRAPVPNDSVYDRTYTVRIAAIV